MQQKYVVHWCPPGSYTYGLTFIMYHHEELPPNVNVHVCIRGIVCICTWTKLWSLWSFSNESFRWWNQHWSQWYLSPQIPRKTKHSCLLWCVWLHIPALRLYHCHMPHMPGPAVQLCSHVLLADNTTGGIFPEMPLTHIFHTNCVLVDWVNWKSATYGIGWIFRAPPTGQFSNLAATAAHHT